MPNPGVSPAYCGPVREKRRRQIRTAIEIFRHFSPCPGSNKIIAGGEVGEFSGSTMPLKAKTLAERVLGSAVALCAAPKNLTELSAAVRLIFLGQ